MCPSLLANACTPRGRVRRCSRRRRTSKRVPCSSILLHDFIALAETLRTRRNPASTRFHHKKQEGLQGATHRGLTGLPSLHILVPSLLSASLAFPCPSTGEQICCCPAVGPCVFIAALCGPGVAFPCVPCASARDGVSPRLRETAVPLEELPQGRGIPSAVSRAVPTRAD